jgi:hypothetical protein
VRTDLAAEKLEVENKSGALTAGRGKTTANQAVSAGKSNEQEKTAQGKPAAEQARLCSTKTGIAAGKSYLKEEANATSAMEPRAPPIITSLSVLRSD